MVHARKHDERRAFEVFLAAQHRPQDTRSAFAAECCRHEPAVLERVHELFARQGRLDDYLEQPPVLPARFFDREHLPCLAPGDVVGDFVIEAELARGGSSWVYRARQSSVHGREVALKVVLVDEADPVRTRDRCEREVEHAITFDHPNLAAVYAHGFEPERRLFYYAMRLVRGESWQRVLDERIAAKAPLPSGALRALVSQAAQVARALGAIHARGVVHRDVKPLNIVIEDHIAPGAESARAVLVDFGLVRTPTTANDALTRVFTRGYAAPELEQGTGVDARADVFALGCSLFDLIAGLSPDSRPRRGKRQRLMPLAVVTGVDPRLSLIVERATDPDPRWRQRDGDELAADLERWLAGVRPRSGGPVAALHRWVAGAGRWRLLLAASLLVVVPVIGWVAFELRAVHAALSRGDLRSVVRGGQRLGPLAAWMLPVGLSDDAPLDSAPLAQVLASLRREGAEAAIMLGAGLLERDGLARQPRVCDFLTFEAAGELRKPRGGPLLPLLSRLFLERPDVDPAAAGASAPLRRLFVEALERAPVGVRLDHAIAALGGCGTPASLLAILGAVEQRVRAGQADATEYARLGAAAAARVLARASACGFAGELDSIPLQDLVARLSRLAAPEPPGRIDNAVEDLLCMCARTCRVRGTAIDLRTLSLPQEPPPRARALALDAALRDELETSWPRALWDRPGSWQQCQACEHYGFLVGAYAVPQWSRTLAERARAFGTQAGLAPGVAVEFFEAGLAAAQLALADPWPFPRPDADTRLSVCLDPVASAAVMLPLDVLEIGVPDGRRVGQPVIRLDFEHQPIAASGAVSAVLLRGGSHDIDSPTALHYLRLGAPGCAELRCMFSAPRPAGGSLQVEVYAQKGLRPSLPYGGEAMLEIEFDGELVDRALSVSGLPDHRFSIAIAPVVAAGAHQVVVRLAAASNTTVRVYSLEVTSR